MPYNPNIYCYLFVALDSPGQANAEQVVAQVAEELCRVRRCAPSALAVLAPGWWSAPAVQPGVLSVDDPDSFEAARAAILAYLSGIGMTRAEMASLRIMAPYDRLFGPQGGCRCYVVDFQALQSATAVPAPLAVPPSAAAPVPGMPHAAPPPERPSHFMLARCEFPGKKKSTAIVLWFLSYFGFLQLHSVYLKMYRAAAVKLAFLVPGMALMFSQIARGSGINGGIMSLGSLLVMVVFVWGIIDIVALFQTRPQDYCDHLFVECRCRRCGKELIHAWRGCTCATCGRRRNREHRFARLPDRCETACAVCGAPGGPAHSWRGGTCAVCGEPRAQDG